MRSLPVNFSLQLQVLFLFVTGLFALVSLEVGMISRQSLVVLSLLAISAGLPRQAAGQDLTQAEAPVKELSSIHLEELKKWMKEDAKYLKWYKLYGNKARRVKARYRPEPPLWLEAQCLGLIGGEGILVDACGLLRQIRDGAQLTKTRETIEEQRKQKEAPKNTSWYEKVHIGGGWPIVSDLKQVKYGAIVETHVSIVDVGRLEINLPGIMFLSVPDRFGKRVLKQATHIGVSFKLKTFTFPGTKQKYLAHLNMSKAKIMDGWSGGFAEDAGLSLMGLSFTIKK